MYFAATEEENLIFQPKAGSDIYCINKPWTKLSVKGNSERHLFPSLNDSWNTYMCIFLDGANALTFTFVRGRNLSLRVSGSQSSLPNRMSESVFYHHRDFFQKQVSERASHSSFGPDRKNRDKTLLCLYHLFQLCTLSHAEVISSHSHFEWPAACVSLWWGQLPVSCQLILPTSFHLPPDVAPICESPAVPKKKSQ